MNRQNGSVLLISLVLLLILTVVGVASISGVTMTEKMTNSQRDYDTAFELAEAALVQGERWLDDYDGGFKVEQVAADCTQTICWTSDCQDGLCFRGEYLATDSLCEVDNSGDPVWQETANWANAADYSEAVPGVESPKYMIEFLCYAPQKASDPSPTPPYSDAVRIYRVTALAYGAHPETRVMLQSTYRVD